MIRAALAGEKVTIEGRTVSLKDFRLQTAPGGDVPIYLAALGPRACRLAGRVADGVIFFLKSPEGVEQALGWVAEGAASAGRDPSDLDCVIRVPVAVDEDPDALEKHLRRLLVTYAMVDVYNRSLADQGFAHRGRCHRRSVAGGRSSRSARRGVRRHDRQVVHPGRSPIAADPRSLGSGRQAFALRSYCP